MWLLFVLAADAPAVAAQVLCTRRIASGSLVAGQQMLLRMLRLAVTLGAVACAAVLALAAPASHFFFAADPALAARCAQLVWARTRMHRGCGG